MPKPPSETIERLDRRAATLIEALFKADAAERSAMDLDEMDLILALLAESMRPPPSPP